MVKNTDLAWLAGIVDGEGCIYGHWLNRRNATGGNVCVEIRIQVTSLTMIAKVGEICRELGVVFTVDEGQMRPKSTKPAHRINIRRQADVVLFLRNIQPYLVVKAEEARTAVSWYEKWGDQRGRQKARATQDDKIVLFDMLRNLKKTA